MIPASALKQAQRKSWGVVLAGLMLTSGSAMAGQLVYTPVNPSFGGNPLNGATLLQKAERQNAHTQPSKDLGLPDIPSPKDQFQQLLENSVLSRLNSEAINQIFNTDGTPINGGSLDTLHYHIEVKSDYIYVYKLSSTGTYNSSNLITKIAVSSP